MHTQPDLPSPGQVCVSVLRVCAEDGISTWREICSQATVPPLAPGYSRDELERLARVLSSQTGALAVVGRALGVRLRSLDVLTRPSATPSAGAAR